MMEQNADRYGEKQSAGQKESSGSNGGAERKKQAEYFKMNQIDHIGVTAAVAEQYARRREGMETLVYKGTLLAKRQTAREQKTD